MNQIETIMLVAERAEPARRFLMDNLAADGYRPLAARSEREARLKLRTEQPAVLLLGALSSEPDELALLRELRAGEAEADPALPVIRLGRGDTQLELLRSFEAGCDHFLPEPFSYLELRARVRASMKRVSEWDAPKRLLVGQLTVERRTRRAEHAGRPLALTRLEFELLAHLAAAPTQVFTKDELLREVWGFQSPGRTRTLDAHAARLRAKLAAAGAPQLVHTVRGVGYRLSLGSPPVAEAIERERHAA
jgi:DNA-binding response OmpR family regulator